MTVENEEKDFKNIFNEVEWPNVPIDLYDRSIQCAEKSNSEIILFFPMRKISKWAFMAFIISFGLGMFQESPTLPKSDMYLEAPFYGISSVYLMQTMDVKS